MSLQWVIEPVISWSFFEQNQRKDGRAKKVALSPVLLQLTLAKIKPSDCRFQADLSHCRLITHFI